MRLFIASPVELFAYKKIREDFKDIIEGKWVEEENLHLTWVFLGELPSPVPVIEKLQQLTPLEKHFEIASLGYFGRPPRVFFAKAEEKLLYEKAASFREAGFDLYRFKPHITLCRIKQIRNYRAFKELKHYYKERILGKILPQITLYESQLSKSGPAYQALFTLH